MDMGYIYDRVHVILILLMFLGVTYFYWPIRKIERPDWADKVCLIWGAEIIINLISVGYKILIYLNVVLSEDGGPIQYGILVVLMLAFIFEAYALFRASSQVYASINGDATLTTRLFYQLIGHLTITTLLAAAIVAQGVDMYRRSVYLHMIL